MATLAVYYASIPIFGGHYTNVCTKSEYGPPDQCKDWDVVTAVVLRLLIGMDEHSGLMAAMAGVIVAVFTGVLWWATEKLWKASERQRRDGRRAIYANIAAARAARKSTEVAEKNLRAAYHPLIVVTPTAPSSLTLAVK